MGKQNDKQIISNTLTIVVGWNSDTISLYINTYSNFNFLKHPFRQGFQPFCICCMHMGKRYDKPTIPNTLTMVGGWNSDTISLYINIYLNFNFRHPSTNDSFIYKLIGQDPVSVSNLQLKCTKLKYTDSSPIDAAHLHSVWRDGELPVRFPEGPQADTLPPLTPE